MATLAARLPVEKTYKIYIGGKFPRTESGRYFELQDKKGNLINRCESTESCAPRGAIVVA